MVYELTSGLRLWGFKALPRLEIGIELDYYT